MKKNILKNSHIRLVKDVGGVKIMDRLSDYKFVKNDLTEQWLIENNFKYFSDISDEDEIYYTYRFPVHKNGGFIVLEGEIIVNLVKKDIEVNVFDYKTRDKYAPFYYIGYGDYTPIMESINKKILDEFKRLGIKKGKQVRNNECKSKEAKRKRSYSYAR
jgi:hypothetical protein